MPNPLTIGIYLWVMCALATITPIVTVFAVISAIRSHRRYRREVLGRHS